MKLKNSIFSILFFSAFLLPSCSSKKEIKIGTQIWATENLSVDHFRNGDLIPEVKTEEEWKSFKLEGKPAWCYLLNKSENGKKYGKLYNWFAVNDSRGLAPEGWHIPSDEEWTELINFLGGANEAAKKMKPKAEWIVYGKDSLNYIGNNESGFSALPGGYGHRFAEYRAFNKEIGIWWSTTKGEYDFNAYIRIITNDKTYVERDLDDKYYFNSVRCLKDQVETNKVENKSGKFIGTWKQKGQFSSDDGRAFLTIESFGENFSVKYGIGNSLRENLTASYNKEFDKLIISTGRGDLDIIINPKINTILFKGDEYEKAVNR